MSQYTTPPTPTLPEHKTQPPTVKPVPLTEAQKKAAADKAEADKADRSKADHSAIDYSQKSHP